MQINNKQDFWSGVMFIGLGVAFAIGATKYSMGTSARMGPGYFPFWLGVCLAGLGAVVALGALSPKAQKTAVEPFHWKVAGIIIGATVLCGLVFNFLGVYISIFLLVAVCSLAAHDYDWKVSFATGLFIVVFVWLAFVKGLKLVFPLWPASLVELVSPWWIRFLELVSPWLPGLSAN